MKGSTRIIKLIYTKERVGDGTKKNPVRLLPQLHALEGGLVAEKDTETGKVIFNPEIMGFEDYE